MTTSKLPDALQARSDGATDTQAMDRRNAYLNSLYTLDGRDDRNHPQHGIFTGLFKKYGSDKQVPVE